MIDNKKRQANIEFLRIISMLMVTIHHAIWHGGVLEQYEFGTVGYILFWTIESLCYVAVNIFVLISGYFMVTSSFKLSRLLKLFFQVEFFSVLSSMISNLAFHRTIGIRDILLTIFPLTSGTYWFMSAYVVLIILSPLLNQLILSMNREQHLLAIGAMTIMFSIIPTLLFWSRDILGNGYDFKWFIVLYFVAAYIRLYHDAPIAKSQVAKYSLLYVVLLCGGGVISRLFIGAVSNALIGEAIGEGVLHLYNSINVFPASICLFIVFKNMKIKNEIVSKLILSLGSVCFGTYLLTDHPLIRECLWETINLPQAGDWGVFVQLGYILLVVLLLFVLGCLIEKVRFSIFKLMKCEMLYQFVDHKHMESVQKIQSALRKNTDGE